MAKLKRRPHCGGELEGRLQSGGERSHAIYMHTDRPPVKDPWEELVSRDKEVADAQLLGKSHGCCQGDHSASTCQIDGTGARDSMDAIKAYAIAAYQQCGCGCPEDSQPERLQEQEELVVWPESQDKTICYGRPAVGQDGHLGPGGVSRPTMPAGGPTANLKMHGANYEKFKSSRLKQTTAAPGGDVDAGGLSAAAAAPPCVDLCAQDDELEMLTTLAGME